jgi:hypothetical protein
MYEFYNLSDRIINSIEIIEHHDKYDKNEIMFGTDNGNFFYTIKAYPYGKTWVQSFYNSDCLLGQKILRVKQNPVEKRTVKYHNIIKLYYVDFITENDKAKLCFILNSDYRDYRAIVTCVNHEF